MVISRRYGFDAHDPLGEIPRRHRLGCVAQLVVGQPKAFTAPELRTLDRLLFGTDLPQPDVWIGQPHRRIKMRRNCPLLRKWVRAHHPGQFARLLGDAPDDIQFGR
jgi:hypothetical protein